MTPERLEPPMVEPLSELGWARVERGLWAKLDAGAQSSVSTTAAPERPSRRWVWIAAPLVAAAAVIAIVVGRPGEDVGPAPVPVAVEPTRYVSGESSSSIGFGNAYVTLEPQTAVVVAGSRTGSPTLVEHGAATFAIAPDSTAPAFVVVAGDATVSTARMIEVKFQVGRSAEIITVAVERGSIDLTFRGQATTLRSGQTWTSATTVPASNEPPAAVDESGADHATDVLESKTPSKPAGASKSAKKSSATPAESERTRYERYTALEVRDPAEALNGYLELAKGTSSWAEVSLFAAARLAGDRKDPRARALLKMYLTRFPKGANAADARVLLDRLPAR